MTRRNTLLFGWALAVVAMAAFASLGIWQYGRMQQKEAMLARAAAALQDKRTRPLDVDTEAMAWVEGEATLDARTLLLDNQIREQRPGVRMYCVAALGDGRARLVDFGWLPVGRDRSLPTAACPAGRVHVRGLLVAPPSSGLRMGNAMQPIARDRWLMPRVDTDAIARTLQLKLAGGVVRLDPKLPIGHARDLDILPNTLPPERHLGYAVQWWALALAVLVTALVLTFRRKRRP